MTAEDGPIKTDEDDVDWELALHFSKRFHVTHLQLRSRWPQKRVLERNFWKMLEAAPGPVTPPGAPLVPGTGPGTASQHFSEIPLQHPFLWSAASQTCDAND